MIVYFLIVFGIYFLVMIALITGWMLAAQEQKKSASTSTLMISVVVAYRNEENYVVDLLNSISTQNYPAEKFEVIFVNDHSSDQSYEKVEFEKPKVLNFSNLHLKDHAGKKQALKFGIARAKGTIIATTDADCTHAEDWLASINASFQKEQTQLSIGAVQMQGDTLWDKIQQMEFFSVMGVTLATFGLHHPIMCNGANLAFRKTAFDYVNGYDDNLHIASGDDEFLLRKVIERFGKSAIGQHSSVVATKTHVSLTDFLRQRTRWASKWKTNPSIYAGILALVMMGVQLLWWPLLFDFIKYGNPLVRSLVFMKIILEFFFLYNVSIYFHKRFNLLIFLLLQLIYAPYVIYVGIRSQFGGIEWKGRR